MRNTDGKSKPTYTTSAKTIRCRRCGQVILAPSLLGLSDTAPVHWLAAAAAAMFRPPTVPLSVESSLRPRRVVKTDLSLHFRFYAVLHRARYCCRLAVSQSVSQSVCLSHAGNALKRFHAVVVLAPNMDWMSVENPPYSRR